MKSPSKSYSVSWSRGSDLYFIGAEARAVLEAGLLHWCSSGILSQHILELFMAKLQGRDMEKSAIVRMRKILHEP